jgi:hypothetical protein
MPRVLDLMIRVIDEMRFVGTRHVTGSTRRDHLPIQRWLFYCNICKPSTRKWLTLGQTGNEEGYWKSSRMTSTLDCKWLGTQNFTDALATILDRMTPKMYSRQKNLSNLRISSMLHTVDQHMKFSELKLQTLSPTFAEDPQFRLTIFIKTFSRNLTQTFRTPGTPNSPLAQIISHLKCLEVALSWTDKRMRLIQPGTAKEGVRDKVLFDQVVQLVLTSMVEERRTSLSPLVRQNILRRSVAEWNPVCQDAIDKIYAILGRFMLRAVEAKFGTSREVGLLDLARYLHV